MISPSQRSAWDPQQYARFHTERSQPFFDLLSLVRPQPAMRVVDLGCGTGELTRHLHQKLGAQETIGIDSSETMLARSWEHAGDGLRFEHLDIGQFVAPGLYDLIFSNAALHWLPGHAQLLRRLSESLTPHGQLAVQVPANHEHASHSVANEIAAEAPFRQALGGYERRVSVLRPAEYATILWQLGYRQQRVEMRVYGHELPGPEDVVEWVKGTTLTDFQRRLPEEVFARFLERYREALLAQLGASRPYYYPFQRILIWAQR